MRGVIPFGRRFRHARWNSLRQDNNVCWKEQNWLGAVLLPKDQEPQGEGIAYQEEACRVRQHQSAKQSYEQSDRKPKKEDSGTRRDSVES